MNIIGQINSSVVTPILTVATLSLLFYLSKRIQRDSVPPDNGWFYLTPGLVPWFALIGSMAMAGAALIIIIIMLFAAKIRVSDPGNIFALGTFLLLGLGFAIGAHAVFISYFRNKVRWNDDCIEKISMRGHVRIAWSEVEDFGYQKGWGKFWVRSKSSRIIFWDGMHGLKQLLCKLAGDEKASSLYDQSRQRS
jgi:hypothetical protein